MEDADTGLSLGILFHGTLVPMVFYFEGNLEQFWPFLGEILEVHPILYRTSMSPSEIFRG